MERFTVMANINGGCSQQSILCGNKTPNPYTSFPPKPNLKDASFSSYLRPEVPKSVTHGCRVEETEISIFDAQKYFNEGQDQKENRKNNSTSIDIDRITEKCDVLAIPRLSSVSSVDGYGRNYRTRSFHATPTSSSEASWNSQSGLLSNPPGSIAVSIRNLPLDPKKRGSRPKWFFGRKCPCSGKKSVQVEEKFSEPKTPVHLNYNSNGSLNPKKQSSNSEDQSDVENTPKESEKCLGISERTKTSLVAGNWAKEQEVVRDSGRFSPETRFPAEIGRRIVPSGRSFSDVGGFSFPILNPPSAGNLILKGMKPATTQLDDPPRESLEVFQPANESLLRKSSEIERTILMPVPGDSNRRSFTFPASPKSRMTVDDDVASDASSDLFEIESFSTQTTSYPMYHRRDSLDDMSSFNTRRLVGNSPGILQFRRSLDETTTPSIAPTECYEPSEASIDWSVTTAEGFDRGSVTNFSISASDYEDMTFIRPETEKVWGGVAGGGKRRGNGLLSCRCEKAVNVGPHPVKFVPEQNRVGSQRLGHVGSNQVIRVSSNKPPLARSSSTGMSRGFAIQ